MNQVLVAEIAKQTGVSASTLLQQGGSMIDFVMFQSGVILNPRTFDQKLMIYAQVLGLLLSSHIICIICTYVIRLIMRGYMDVLFCILAICIPTFAITFPVYRFKTRPSLRRRDQ